MNDTPRAEGQQFDHDQNFAFTRCAETGVESIPQIIMQALALAITKEERGLRQYLSLVISCLSIANTVMGVNYDIDANETWRVIERLVFGYIPEGAAGDLVNVATFAFVLCFVLAKVFSVAVLFSVSRLALGVVVAGEFGFYTLVRVTMGNWRLYMAAGESTVLSLLMHTVSFLITLAAPFSGAGRK